MFIKDFFLELFFPEKTHHIKLDRIPTAPTVPLPWAHAFFDYRSPSGRSLIYLFKKFKNKKRDKILSRYFTRYLRTTYPLTITAPNTLITVIPVTKKSYKKRGFNQCENLAREISRQINIPFCNTLTSKEKRTKQGLIINRKQRYKNMKSIFTITNKELIKNKNIIIIEDIITSGATATSAKNTLEKQGAKNVLVIAIAH